MASKHYDFELRANLFNDVKVDENCCPHRVCLFPSVRRKRCYKIGRIFRFFNKYCNDIIQALFLF